MNKRLLFFMLLCFTLPTLEAQDIDYVISNPGNETPTKLRPPARIDTNFIANPDYTSYFLSPTAYTLKKKRIRLSGTDIVYMKGSYGLTDNTMFSVSLSLFGTFTGSLKQHIELTEGLSIGLSASGGRLLFQSLDTTVFFGGGEAMITLGDHQNNITVGTGFYYINSSFDLLGNGDEDFMINNVYMGFQKQLRKKIYVMGEVIYFINYQIITGSIGIKVVVGDRISLNFGIMPFGYNDPSTNKLTLEPIAIPLISFRLLLGKNR